MPELSHHYDVLVIGAGNAALCAAITARRAGASVLILESAPKDLRGGNSCHTRNIRYAHKAPTAYVTGPYPEQEYWEDLLRVTKGSTNPEFARLVIGESEHVVDWMMNQGVRFQPPLSGTLGLGRTNAFFLGGGKAMMNAYFATAEALDIRILYEAEATDLEIRDGKFTAAHFMREGESHKVNAKTAVIASGGFESNIEWLKEGWGEIAENFLIRGTRFNMGRMLQVLIDKGARPVGEPDQCHAVAIDGRSPKYDGGICTRVDCVIYSIVVNQIGERFYDEGEDVWPRRYAIWGRLIAKQPGQIAYAIIDSKAQGLFMPTVFPPLAAGSIPELAAQLNIDADRMLRTITEYNNSVQAGEFNSSDLDGCATANLEPPKSNWARTIDIPPFYGYPLRPGITFTYLGVEVDKTARVIFDDGIPAENIFAAGEVMAGNILGQGYAGGVGLAIGTVFGRIAGKEAARCATN